MPKQNDKDLDRFFDAINTDPQGIRKPEPAFQRYRKHFLRDFDWNTIKKYRPEEIIASARTQEELFIIGEYLEREWGRDHYWWKAYDYKRVQLGYLPSVYDIKNPGTPQAKAVFGAPVSPQEFFRSGVQGSHGIAVNRHVFQKTATWEQVTGQKALYNVIETAHGPELKAWSAIKGPKLRSNIPKTAIVFDFETTDLLNKDARILSMGVHDTKIKGAQPTSVFAQFNREKTYSHFVESTIIPQYLKASKGQNIISEKALVEQAVSMFENLGDRAIMGYNIKQFDIPLLYERAKTYGIHGRLEKAILGNKDRIIDVAEYTEAFVSQHIGGKYIGWSEGDVGLKSLGWKLEAVAKSIGYKSKTGVAHNAAEDVAMTSYVWEQLNDPKKRSVASRKFQKSVDTGLFEDLVTKLSHGKQLKRVKTGEGFVRYAGMLDKESKYTRSFMAHMAAEVGPPPGATIGEAARKTKSGIISRFAAKKLGKGTVGGALRYAGVFTATNLIFPGGFVRNAASTAAWEAGWHTMKNKGGASWKRFAAAAAGSIATNVLWEAFSSNPNAEPVKFQNRFSGADDAYNTVMGFQEQGLAPEQRHNLTEFGSGYQGMRDLPSSLMGVPIDPEILRFREEVMDRPLERSEMEAELKRRQAEVQQYIGKLKREDTREADLSRIRGLNQKNKYLREVRLERFAVEVEDADTLLLHRKGLSGLFSDPIQVRLSGVDAPEVAGHANDPMESIRIWQEQAGGGESTERLAKLIQAQEDLRLVVDIKQQTYGRSLGALVGDGDKNLALESLRQGITAALPFGDPSKDIVSRQAAAMAEAEAVQEEAGIWGFARYKAIQEASKGVGKDITFNVLTEKHKLARNLSLGAYGSFLQGLGEEERELTAQEQATAYRLGRSLRKSFGPRQNGQRFSGTDDAHNTIEGLRHDGGMSAGIRRNLTAFGSGFIPALAKNWTQTGGTSEIKREFGIGYKRKKYTVDKTAGLVQQRPNTIQSIGSLFSGIIPGSDDAYNTIEGLRHDGGLAANIRRYFTDFGSGYVGGLSGEGLRKHIIKDFLEETAGFTGDIEKGFSILIDPDQFKKAYRRLAMSYHPDKGGTDEAFREMTAFYAMHKNKTTLSSGMFFAKQGAEAVPSAGGAATKVSSFYEEFLRNVDEFRGVRENVSNTVRQAGLQSDENFARIVSISDEMDATLSGVTRNIEKLEELGSQLDDINKTVRTPAAVKTEIQQMWKGIFKKSAIASAIGLSAFAAYQYFSGRDDEFNTIEGLRHEGLSSGIRKILTDFGSGWDPLKAMAKTIFKNEKDAFGKMVKSSEFQKSLESAAVVKELGFGATATANLMEANFKGQKFQFVRKSGMIMDDEVAAMRAVEESVGPSVYGSRMGQIDMEHFAGKILGDVSSEELAAIPDIEEKITSTFRELHKTGWRHGDAHLGNIMLMKSPEGSPMIGLIDFGAAKKLSSFSPDEVAYQVASDLSSAKTISSSGSFGFTPATFGGSTAKAPVQEEEDIFGAAMEALGPAKKINTPSIPPPTDLSKARRMKNFRKTSAEAVGVGHRAALNAGKGHVGYTTSRPG